MGTFIDLNDLVGYVSSISNDLFRFSKTNGLTVIGNADLLKLSNLLIEDIATSYSHIHATTHNSGSYMEHIYERLQLLQLNYDPGITGIEQWYDFVDIQINLPLTNIITDHINQHGSIRSINTYSHAPNVWFIV